MKKARFPSLCSKLRGVCVVLLWLNTQFTVIKPKPRGFCSPSASVSLMGPVAVNLNVKTTT